MIHARTCGALPGLRLGDESGKRQVHGDETGMALKSAVRIELPVGSQVREDGRAVDVEVVAGLRPDPASARRVRSEDRALASVGRELLIDVADRPYEKLLVEELRRGKVEVRIEPVGVVGRGVGEIAGEAERRRELGSRLCVEIGVRSALYV